MRVSAVMTHSDKVLLIHRLKDGSEYFVFPGGGVEAGETAEEALRREVHEETSYDLKSFRPLFDNENRGRMERYFHVAFDGNPHDLKIGGPEVGRQSENNSYRLEWIDLADIGGLNLLPDFAKAWVTKNFYL